MRYQVMKRYLYYFAVIFYVSSGSAIAAWEVARPEMNVPREPFFQAGAPQRVIPAGYGSGSFPNQFANFGQPAAMYCVTISGSLKENIERIMCRYHWRVVWKAPVDFNFDGRVTGTSLPNVIQKIFRPFPLQAVMYMSNRTLMVVPRQITGVEKCLNKC